MYIFDFDGVLINSAKEAGLSAYNTVTGKFFTKLSDIPTECFTLYLNNIIHFHNPYTLCTLMTWCINNYEKNFNKILSREEFASYSKELNLNPKEITPYFFSIREKFISQDPINWANLNEPFLPLWNDMINYGTEKIIILTAKNKKAVLTLCKHYDLNVLDENIYAGDGNKTKIDNLKLIHSRFNLPLYNFIDDHLFNLVNLNDAFKNDSSFTLKLLLCDWGYGHVENRETAKSLGFEVVSMNELRKLLF